MTLTGWALSGGGSRGSFQVGAMRRLVESGIVPDVVAGVSIGALNGGKLAELPKRHAGDALNKLVELEKVWLRATTKDVYRHRFWLARLLGGPEWLNTLGVAITGADSLKDWTPALSLIRKNISAEAVAASPIESYFGFVDFRTGAYVRWAGRGDAASVHHAVAASAAIPVFFPAERWLSMVGMDGGVVEGTPLVDTMKALFKRNGTASDVVYIISCSGLPARFASATLRGPDMAADFGGIKLGGIFDVAERAFNLMTVEKNVNDVLMGVALNGLLDERETGPRRLSIRIIYPNRGLGRSTIWDPKQAEANMEHGYERAGELMDKEMVLSPFNGGQLMLVRANV